MEVRTKATIIRALKICREFARQNSSLAWLNDNDKSQKDYDGEFDKYNRALYEFTSGHQGVK